MLLARGPWRRARGCRGRQPVAGEPWDGERAAERHDPGDSLRGAWRRGARSAAAPAGGSGPGQGARARGRRARGGSRAAPPAAARADRPVRRREHAPERGRESVHGAQPRVGQAEASEQAGQRQSFAIVGRLVGAGRLWQRHGRRGSAAAEREIPSRARASVSGLARFDVNGSMSCESASRPARRQHRGRQPQQELRDRPAPPAAACAGCAG